MIDALVGYLHYRQECGERNIEMDPAVLAILTALPKVPLSGMRPQPVIAPPDATITIKTAVLPAAPVSLPPPAAPADDTLTTRQAALAVIASAAAACQRCALGKSRTRIVSGQGNPCAPEIMFIVEAPISDADSQPPPSINDADQLLTKMIGAMGFTREQIYIANVCKCRPPNNRQPTLDEMQTCLPYLRAQLAIIKPKTIVVLGASAVTGLLDTQQGVSRLRGRWTRYENVPLMPTFHPTYLLRYPTAKKNSWEDLKAVLKHLGRPAPARPATSPSPSSD